MDMGSRCAVNQQAEQFRTTIEAARIHFLLEHVDQREIICGLSSTYVYFQGATRLGDSSWQSRSWRGFNNEQQASIVDDWFEAHFADVGSPEALRDPAFRFIRDNIRAGVN